MKFSYSKSKKLLTNKYFLYFVLLLSCFYLLYLLLEKRFNLVIVFGLISYIIYCFNKNMIVVLGISLIITFISTLGMKVKEGLENNTTPSSTTPTPTSTTPTSQQKMNGTTTSPNLIAGSSPTTSKTMPTTTTTTSSTTNTPEATSSTTESMNSMSRKRGRFDENAASVNDTYSDLNNLLDNGSGSNMNIDTKQLLEQQAQLTEAMKNMGPLIESAKTLMNGMNFDGLNNLASSLVSKK
jgi:hypothetical protein